MRRCTKNSKPPPIQQTTSLKKMRSWWKNVSKSFGRKNALPLRCCNDGCGSDIPRPLGSLILFSSAEFLDAAEIQIRANLHSNFEPLFARLQHTPTPSNAQGR